MLLCFIMKQTLLLLFIVHILIIQHIHVNAKSNNILKDLKISQHVKNHLFTISSNTSFTKDHFTLTQRISHCSSFQLPPPSSSFIPCSRDETSSSLSSCERPPIYILGGVPSDVDYLSRLFNHLPLTHPDSSKTIQLDLDYSCWASNGTRHPKVDHHRNNNKIPSVSPSVSAQAAGVPVARVEMDACLTSAYSQNKQAVAISCYHPDAKFLVLLRDPVSSMFSQYQQLLKQLSHFQPKYSYLPFPAYLKYVQNSLTNGGKLKGTKKFRPTLLKSQEIQTPPVGDKKTDQIDDLNNDNDFKNEKDKEYQNYVSTIEKYSELYNYLNMLEIFLEFFPARNFLLIDMKPFNETTKNMDTDGIEILQYIIDFLHMNVTVRNKENDPDKPELDGLGRMWTGFDESYRRQNQADVGMNKLKNPRDDNIPSELTEVYTIFEDYADEMFHLLGVSLPGWNHKGDEGDDDDDDDIYTGMDLYEESATASKPNLDKEVEDHSKQVRQEIYKKLQKKKEKERNGSADIEKDKEGGLDLFWRTKKFKKEHAEQLERKKKRDPYTHDHELRNNWANY